MAKFKITRNSYEVNGTWVSAGVVWINEGLVDQQIPLGPSEIKFKTKDEANNYVNFLARTRRPDLFKNQ